MATDADNIATIQSNILATLAAESANPKPTYTINGQTVSWNEYRASLLKQLKDLAELKPVLDGPWEVTIEGMP